MSTRGGFAIEACGTLPRPRRRRPAGAKEGLARVPAVAPEDMTEAEAGMYDGLSAPVHRRGGVRRARRKICASSAMVMMRTSAQ